MSISSTTTATAHSLNRRCCCRVRPKASRQATCAAQQGGEHREGIEQPSSDQTMQSQTSQNTFSCRCGACCGGLLAIPRRWEVTTDPSLRAACAAAVVALVPVPITAVHWTSRPSTSGAQGQIAAIHLTEKTRQWVPTSADEGDPLAAGSVVAARRGRRTTLWYCRRCRSRLLVTGLDKGLGGDGDGRTGEIVRLFAGALIENDNDDDAPWRDGEIEWSDAPPVFGEGGQGESANAVASSVSAHWFPTAEDGATPGAPFIRDSDHVRSNAARRAVAAAGAAGAAENVTANKERRRDDCVFACACGAVRAVSTVRVDQLQHCHCAMCRSIHGAPFATWAPLPESAVSWEEASDVGALRAAPTSGVAVRHGCDECGTTLSIKYRSQPDTVWLAAGAAAAGDVTPLGEGMRRVLHISCSWRSAWWPVTGEEQRTGIPRAG